MNVFYCGEMGRCFRTGGELFLNRIYKGLSEKGYSIDGLSGQDLVRLKGDGGYFKKNLFLYKILCSVPPSATVVQNILNLDYLKYFLANVLIRYRRKDLKFLLIVQQIYYFNLNTVKRIVNKAVFFLYLRFFDKIVTTSQFLKKELMWQGAKEEKISVIGAACQEFRARKICRKEDRLSAKLLCVGHIRRIKGQVILVQALKYLKDLNWNLILVGDVSSEDIGYKEEVAKKIEELELAERVFWAGRLEDDELAKLYTESDIVVVPSLYEGYGIVVQEAMSFGAPVVASNVGGIPESLKDKKEGFLFEGGSPKSLAMILRRLITDPELRKQIGAQAWKRAFEFPTWDMVCQNFYQVITSIKRQKVKGLLITETFPPLVGGVETFLQSICTHSSMEIDVLTENTPGADKFDKIASFKIRRSNIKPCRGFIQYLFNGIQLCMQNKYDFIFVGSFSPVFYAAIWLKRIFRLPLVLLYHGFDLERQLQSNVSRTAKALRYCDQVITNSSYNFKRYLELFPSANKTKILNPGVDTSFFRVLDESELNWVELSAKDSPVILSVGRLVEKKNHEMVLRCLAKVAKRFPAIKYLIVGDGPELTRLQELTKELGLSGNVVFLGIIINKRKLVQLYNMCDLFVLPSKERKMDDNGRIDVETFGIAFLEANACGKPVIGGNTGGISDAIVHGVTGYLVDPYDENELAEKIVELLTDKEKAERMGEAGRKRAVDEFDWKKVVNKFDEFLSEVVS